MNDAEKRLLITRLLLVTFLGFTLSLARAYMRAKREVEANEVIGDVELFLKVSRLQELVLAEHSTIIKGLEGAWSNLSYRDVKRGDLNAIKVTEWIKQNSTDTLSP